MELARTNGHDFIKKGTGWTSTDDRCREREEGGDLHEEGNKVDEHRQEGHGERRVEILEEQFCMSACAGSVHAQDTQHYSAENS